MSLGERIHQLRTAAGLSKAGLARRVGVSDVSIGYWETGTIKQVGHDRLLALAGALGCTVSELLDDPLLASRDAELKAAALFALSPHLVTKTDQQITRHQARCYLGIPEKRTVS